MAWSTSVRSGRGKVRWLSSRWCHLTRSTGMTWHWSSTTLGELVVAIDEEMIIVMGGIQLCVNIWNVFSSL